MKEINNKLDGLNELVTRIDAKILDINNKLDEVIAALHEYDNDNFNCEYSGLPSVMAYDETVANERMDIIGQNGNEGSHYVTNEEADEDAATFNDYGMRVVDKDKSNNSAKHVGEKKRNKRKYYKPKQ
jgi:hypothetical protein